MNGAGKSAPFEFLGAIRPIAFIVVYLLLDLAASIDNLAGTEITPWAPQIALLTFVAVRYGIRWGHVTVFAPGLAAWWLRDASPMGIQFWGATACIGCTYTTAGLVLRRMLRRYPQPTIAWFATFLATIACAALLNAVIYTEFLVKTGKLRADLLISAVRTDWVGDVNGVIALVPLTILLQMGDPGKLTEARAHRTLLVWQILALLCAFLLTFPEIWGYPEDDTRNPFYLLYLPIIWIALRWGASVTAVSLATLQLAIVVLVAPHNSPETFVGIQVLMVLLVCTGLFMGIAVSENARISQLMRSKDTELASLNARMAVSEMNAAIGHELNNPLAALVNYLTSANLILESPNLDRALLQSALSKAHAEAIRSISVLRKLREFFRSGAVRPELVDPRKLAVQVMAATQQKFRHANITAVVESAPVLPPIKVDPLQIAMVLQNLLANAYDAVVMGNSEARRIIIGVVREGEEVLLRVSDTGHGIPSALRDQLFRPVTSMKPAGMGLGLAICRSLVEANDGRIAVLRSDRDGTSIGCHFPAAQDTRAARPGPELR